MITHGFQEIEWELGADQKGQHSLMIGKRPVHSLYDADGQAIMFVRSLLKEMESQEKNLLVLIGLGLGYIPKALYNQGFTDVIVWDPFPLMRHFIPVHGETWSEKIVQVQTFGQFCSHFMKKLRPSSKVHIIKHPGYEPFCSYEYKQAQHFLQSILSPSQTLCLENSVISQRSLDNLPLLPFFPSIVPLLGKFAGHKAIVVSPGPSLQSCLPSLEKKKNGKIIAALQALPLLQKSNIEVDFVIIADPGDLSNFLKLCKKGREVLLADSCVHPSVLAWNPEKTHIFNLVSDQLHQLLWPKYRDLSIDEPCATVSEISVILAKLLGFKDILMLGMDFCWSQERYSFRPKNAQEKPETLFRLRAKDGIIAETYQDYYHAYRFLGPYCGLLRREGISVTQYTEGMPISHAKALEIEDLFETLQQSPSSPSPSLPHHEVNTRLVASAERLLRLAQKSTHLNGRTERKSVRFESSGNMPFLDELPLEKRKEACEKALQQVFIEKGKKLGR